MRTFVVIPGYNEETYIASVLQKLQSVHADVIFIDDGSSDDTYRIAKENCGNVLHHETNLGKGAAMKTGAEYAFHSLGADAVIFFDADDQHDPKEIPKFLKELEKFDVVFGVRKMNADMPLLRFLGNKAASVLLNILYGGYIPDIPSGYKGVTKKGYEKTHWVATGYEVETEIAMRVARAKVPFTVVEIDTIYHDTDKGMNALDALHICMCLVEWRVGL